MDEELLDEILKFIQNKERASFDEILRHFSDISADEMKKALENLIALGEIYEPCPGVFKIL